ncbi:ROK family protein [Planctomycetaceae bacterium SH139]
MSDVEKPVWIGFDLGGTKMLAVVFDDQLKPLGRKRRRTRGNEGSDFGIARIGSTILRALEECEVAPERVAGIGIGCPGPVDPIAGKLLTAVNLGWDDVAVGPLLKKQFSCPVAVLNDVDAGVYGEYRFGSARGARCAVGIFPGTGIGGGCVYEDQILRGANITCMEIGHTRITSSARSSGFELPGTLEAESSRLTIAAEAAKAAYRGDAPFLLKNGGTDIADIRSSQLADAIKAGDKIILDLVVDAMETVGMAVVNIVHLLAPDKIILGGGLVEAMEELVVATVQKTAKKHVLPAYRSCFEVVSAKLGDDAATLGAAAWIRKQTIEEEPPTAPSEKQ